MSYLYRSLNGTLPEIFHDYFQRRRDIHHHNTIHSDKLHVPRARTLLGQTTIKVKGAQLFNELPTAITSKDTYKAFTKAAKSHYIQQYI